MSHSPEKSFVQNVQKWVLCDKQLRAIADKQKTLREIKHETSKAICDYIQTKNLHNTTIELNDGELLMYEKREYAPLTFSYVEECLSQIIEDETQVDFIMEYIRSHREIKITTEVKRTYSAHHT